LYLQIWAAAIIGVLPMSFGVFISVNPYSLSFSKRGINNVSSFSLYR